MAFALIAHTFAVSAAGDGVTTPAINTTGADILVVGISDIGGSGTITDSKGNTWTPLSLATQGSLHARLVYAKSPTVGSGHTFTVTDTGGFPSIYVAAFSGSNLSAPFDQENTGTSASGTTVQPGSITPSADNELIVTMEATNSTPKPYSIDSGFVITDSSNNAGSNFAGALACLIQTSAAAVNPTWTMSQSLGQAATIASFKAAAVAGGDPNLVGEGGMGGMCLAGAGGLA